MSALFIFEVKTNQPKAEIRKTLARLWGFDSPYEIAVRSYEPNGSHLCTSGIYMRSHAAEQKIKINQIVNYLFSISSDNRVYYYTWGEYPNEAKEMDDEIEVEDIFAKYEPWLMKGSVSINLRFPLRNPRA